MARWLVTLAGENADLERLVEWPDGEDWQILRHEKRGVVLCGPKLEAAESHECVACIADELISHINRAAKYEASDFQGVSRSYITEQRQGGDHLHLDACDGLYVHTGRPASLTHRAPDGTIIETSEDRARNNFRRLVRLQKSNSHLADALRYIEEEPSLPGFYKTGEAILRAIGKPKKWDALEKLGWTSDDELWRFTGSAHEKRHHRHPGPPKPMTEEEAEVYIRALLDKLIVHLDSTA
jgi:hypothetical protein